MAIFRKALGDTPIIKVLDFLIEGRELDYSLSDITRNAGVSWTTLHRIWNTLEQFHLVKATRHIGRAKLYTLNKENQAVQDLIKVYDTLLHQHTETHLKKKVLA